MSQSVFFPIGNYGQNELVEEALRKCDFDFSLILPSLAKEGKSRVEVRWEDLSRYNERQAVRAHGTVTVNGKKAKPQEREVDGRHRVLGLFYLPPFTEIVLDRSLERDPILAQEVFLAEAAHCVDYHFLTSEHRRLITNTLHEENLPPDADVRDGAAFHLDGHTCSWFDVGPYEMWVGEAFMESFVECFAPSIPVTISLNHPTSPDMARIIRQAILGQPEPEEQEDEQQPSFPEPSPEPSEPVVEEPHAHLTPKLEAALRKYRDNKGAAKYMLDAIRDAGIQ